jgi:S-formylglutathione hydrolase FrmB
MRAKPGKPAAIAIVAVIVLGIAFVVVSLARSDTRGAEVVSFSVKSRFVGRTLHERAVIPAGVRGGERPPLLVLLHGRGGHPGDVFWDELYAELERLGPRAPIVVELDGGDHSYYHDRRSGRWGSYVMREAIPATVERLAADPKRVAIGGISMGGFAALDLARLHPGRFCAAGGHSPAIWLHSGDTAPGAFDSAADFGRHDLYAYARGRAHPFGRTPVWIDRGSRDPFAPGDSALVSALHVRGANVTSHVWPGAHEGDYWRAHIASYVRWYAARLAAC